MLCFHGLEVRIALQGQVVARVPLQISRTAYPDVDNLVQLSFSMASLAHHPRPHPPPPPPHIHPPHSVPVIHKILSIRTHKHKETLQTGLRVLEWEEQSNFPCEYAFDAQNLCYVESEGEIRINYFVWLHIDYQDDLQALAAQNNTEITLLLAGSRMHLTRARVCVDEVWWRLKFEVSHPRLSEKAEISKTR